MSENQLLATGPTTNHAMASATAAATAAAAEAASDPETMHEVVAATLLEVEAALANDDLSSVQKVQTIYSIMQDFAHVVVSTALANDDATDLPETAAHDDDYIHSLAGNGDNSPTSPTSPTIRLCLRRRHSTLALL